jgi:uncharacterized protein YodC (DUF2158 family)
VPSAVRSYDSMAESKFEPGDTVKLESGGPRMTITFESAAGFRSAWFVQPYDKIHAEDLPPEALEHDNK